jgi:hypothetical protein
MFDGFWKSQFNTIIMSLQSFVGSWPLFQFLDSTHSRQDSLDGRSARYKAATYTQNNTNRKKNAHNTDIHDSSGIRTKYHNIRAVEDISTQEREGIIRLLYGNWTERLIKNPGYNFCGSTTNTLIFSLFFWCSVCFLVL